MAQPRVLVTRRWPAAVEAQLRESYDVVLSQNDTPMSSEALRAALSEFDAILPTVTDKIGAEVLGSSRLKTKILANYGVGYSHIDVGRAADRGIAVTNTPDVLSECTADLAMMLLLMTARRASEGERELRAGAWAGWRPTHLVGTKVTGKVLGIVGFGRIGQALAQRAHFGFGMKILVHNRRKLSQDVLDKFNAQQVDDIDALLPLCDFVSLHCPGGPDNRHLINAERLCRMKESAILINTARGEVVDEVALAHALWFETIGGAALDVYDGEPRICRELMQSDKVVMLPHLGSATHEAREAMGLRVIENLNDFFEGREPRDRIN